MNKKLLAIVLFSIIFLNAKVNLTSAQPVCGDNVCSVFSGENCQLCPADCPCPAGYTCDPGNPNADIDGCVAPNPPAPAPACPPGAICIDNPLKAQSLEELIDAIVNFIFWFAMALAPLMIIIAGFLFLTAGGEPDKINKAKNIITYTFIGLLIILLAKGLISALKTVLGG